MFVRLFFLETRWFKSFVGVWVIWQVDKKKMDAVEIGSHDAKNCKRGDGGGGGSKTSTAGEETGMKHRSVKKLK